MPRKKKEESMLEKTEKVAGRAAKKISKEVSEVIGKTEDALEGVVEEVKDSLKQINKKTRKPRASSNSDKLKHEDKLAKLKEKAAKLAEGIKSEEVDLKKKIKDEEEKKDTLAPIEDYLKSSIHLGTRAITPDMKQYVYKRRADSLAVFNTSLLDDKIKEGAEYLAQYAPDEAIVVCKREAGAKAVEMFSKITGIRSFIKKYPAGIITNPNLDKFLETEMVFVCDPWTDKSALIDAKRIKIPVLAICDTNNYTTDIDKVIPGNNKSAKSLGMIFYLITKIYVEKRKLPAKVPPISEWIENWENLQPPK